MNRLIPTIGAALAALLSLPAAAADGVATNVRLTCNVTGLHADGSRIQGTGAEEIAIDIRRVNIFEKDPSRPASWRAVSDIRVTGNGRAHEAVLLKSAADRVAFAVVSDATVDSLAQTLALTYEIRLDQMRLKRTAMTLFSAQGSNLQAAESNCVRTGGTAATPAAAGPTPAWLTELRRKLKECGEKDMFSQSACVERMQDRYCSNRTERAPECEKK